MIFSAVSGCGKRRKNIDETKVLAKIDNYNVTVQDFTEQAYIVLSGRRGVLGSMEEKEKILNNMIEEKLLVQEAQKFGMDKEKEFVNEIRKYWEQTLVKLLLKSKADDLARSLSASDSEVLDVYNRIQVKISADFVILKNKADAERLSLSGDKFDDTAKNLIEKKLIVDHRVGWWGYDDLPAELEYILFATPAVAVSQPVFFSGRYVVFRVNDIRKEETAPIDELKNKIRSRILKRKKETLMEEWINGLVRNAKITIDKKLLEEIEVNSEIE